MEIKNRLFTYPVLTIDTDDYITGSFIPTTTVKDVQNYLSISITFNLDNRDLQNLINKDKAEYVIHVECSATSYRHIIKTQNSNMEFRIDKRDINGTVEFLAMVVSKEQIENYAGKTLNEDYSEDIITFEKSSILAYYNLPKIVIAKNYEELAHKESFFSIIRVDYEDDSHRPIEVDFDDVEKIKIRVDASTYNTYLKFKQSHSLARAIFILPALLEFIDVVRGYGSVEDFVSKRWYLKMQRSYKANGGVLEEDIFGDKTALEIAQEMLNMPVSEAYDELNNMVE